MDKKPSGFKARWKARYHHASIQLILSIAFTAVAVIGMLFLGMALLLRFSSSANEMAAESSQRVLAQVNWNLDSTRWLLSAAISLAEEEKRSSSAIPRNSIPITATAVKAMDRIN